MSLYKMLKPTEVLMLHVGSAIIKIKLKEAEPGHGVSRTIPQPAYLDIDAPLDVLISSMSKDKIWIGDPKQ